MKLWHLLEPHSPVTLLLCLVGTPLPPRMSWTQGWRCWGRPSQLHGHLELIVLTSDPSLACDVSRVKPGLIVWGWELPLRDVFVLEKRLRPGV